MPRTKPEFKEIPIEKLQRGKYQPRSQFDKEALEELAQSIREQGIVQPIVIRPMGAEGHYEIVAGERRWRAAQLAGLEAVPCLINQYSEEQAAEITAVENINRVDLNPIEEAQAYQRLIKEFHYLHEEVAAALGKSRTKISNALRLLTLDKRVQEFLINGELSEGHGKVLAGLPEKLHYEVAVKCIRLNWSVRRTEQEIKALQQSTSAIQTGVNPNIVRLERLSSEQLGYKVQLDADLNDRSGWLKIRYHNNETLAGILDKIGIEYD